MISRSLKAVIGFKLHRVDDFYASFGVFGRASKLVALTTGGRNQGFGEVEVKTQRRTILVVYGVRMDCLLGVLGVVQLAHIESVRQAAHEVIKDDSLGEVHLNHFFVGWLQVLHGERPDSEDIVHALIVVRARGPDDILDDQVEGKTGWVLLGRKE